MAKEAKVSKVIIDILAKIVQLLKEHKIPYAIMGGIALQAWGRERATKDIDIMVSLDKIEAAEFLGALKRED